MISIAIVGYGTVGGGVDRLLRENRAVVESRLGEEIAVKYILVRREPAQPDPRKVMDFSVIEQDDEVRFVVETIGGCGPALEYTRRALAAGKHVVTANKELVARHGRELLALAKENGVGYLFEACVGGGIPIVRPLMRCLAATDVTEICGVLNGTTNYIITRMDRGGATFAEALREAQALGYAEADPSADVNGLDTGRKLCVLADLAFGGRVLPEQIATDGIARLNLTDVAIARRSGYCIRLLGRTVRQADGSVVAYVAPHVIPGSSPFSAVEDVYNAILVRSEPLGDSFFYGRGAGALPTASAVVADIIDLVRQKEPLLASWGEDAVMASSDELHSRWYFRGTQVPQNAQVLAQEGEETAFLLPAMAAAPAQAQARQLGASACLRVLD